MMDDLIKASMAEYLKDMAHTAETDMDTIYSLLIELMMEEGVLASDVERVLH